MSTWDLARIRYTVRKLTGHFDTTQLPDNSPGPGLVTVNNPPGIDDYINDFYLYDFPEHLRSLKLKQYLYFSTVPNCGTYSIPQYINQLEPPIYVDNYRFMWYQNPEQFQTIWPELNFIDQNLFTPNGTQGTSADPFEFTLTQTPVQQGTVTIGLIPNQTPYTPLETFTDRDQPIPLDIPLQQYFVNPAPLYGNLGGTGTIDYITGAVSLSYATAPPAGLNSSCHYHPYVAARTRDIMYFQNQLFLRPIPNDVYGCKVLAYMLPTVVLSAATNATVQPIFDPTTGTIEGFNGTADPENPNLSNLPTFNEWWQVIAYGAAIKILIEEGDYQEANMLKPIFEEQKLLAQRKALKQLANQRIQTPYSPQQSPGSTWPIFPLY